jgi:hypothetical protein
MAVEEHNFVKQLFSITTLIQTKVIKEGKHYSSQASGFFYNEVTPRGPVIQGKRFGKLEKFWLITNRHVALPKINGIECLPDSFVFCIRQEINGAIEWKTIVLTKEQMRLALKLHKDNTVDVVAIDVSPYIREIMDDVAAAKGVNKCFWPVSLSNLNLPTNQRISIDVASDIIVASYPKGFYDEVNMFPIVKSGIVASAWGFKFKGYPMFQIDAQLFPGSSGGLVISKPADIVVINGEIKRNDTKTRIKNNINKLSM